MAHSVFTGHPTQVNAPYINIKQTFFGRSGNLLPFLASSVGCLFVQQRSWYSHTGLYTGDWVCLAGIHLQHRRDSSHEPEGHSWKHSVPSTERPDQHRLQSLRVQQLSEEPSRCRRERIAADFIAWCVILFGFVLFLHWLVFASQL